MTVNPIPTGCNSVNVYLVVKDPRAAIEFYTKAFDGTANLCMEGPDGSVMHAEVRIGNSTVMVSQENPEWHALSPEALGGSPASLHLYVDNCDAAFEKAVAAGCTAVFPVADMFWGDRYGKVVDPFGYQWGIATHVEDVSEQEMKKRSEAWFAQMAESQCDGAGGQG